MVSWISGYTGGRGRKGEQRVREGEEEREKVGKGEGGTEK